MSIQYRALSQHMKTDNQNELSMENCTTYLQAL